MPKEGSIRLHPQHGVNPTMCQCWWCGKERGDIALLGAAYKGEAPRMMVVDLEPCAACAEQQNKGITLIEVSPTGTGREIAPGERMTGRWAVITEDALRGWIKPGELLDHALKLRKALLPPEVFKLVLPGEASTE